MTTKMTALLAYQRGKLKLPTGYRIERDADLLTLHRADVYVFCLYAERVPERADTLDIESWEFYVLSTPTIDERFGGQKKVRLSRIKEVESPVGYDDLRGHIDRALNGHGHR